MSVWFLASLKGTTNPRRGEIFDRPKVARMGNPDGIGVQGEEPQQIEKVKLEVGGVGKENKRLFLMDMFFVF